MSDMPSIQRRVVLIEDDAWIRSFIRDALTDEGYEVVEAADGRTGLRMVKQHRPDVVLLDLAMPEVTGLDVLHELRRDASTRNIPVLIMSAYTRILGPEADRVSGVLPKPIDVAKLLQQIQTVLSHTDDS